MSKIYFKVSSLVTSSIFLLQPTAAHAAVAQVNQSGGFATLDQLVVVFANLTSAISTLAGFAVLIMLIRGGISYITAQGDPKALTTARSTMTWAIIGLVIILAAFLIISLIVGFVSVPGIGKFCLPGSQGNLTVDTYCK